MHWSNEKKKQNDKSSQSCQKDSYHFVFTSYWQVFPNDIIGISCLIKMQVLSQKLVYFILFLFVKDTTLFEYLSSEVARKLCFEHDISLNNLLHIFATFFILEQFG